MSDRIAGTNTFRRGLRAKVVQLQRTLRTPLNAEGGLRKRRWSNYFLTISTNIKVKPEEDERYAEVSDSLIDTLGQLFNKETGMSQFIEFHGPYVDDKWDDEGII